MIIALYPWQRGRAGDFYRSNFICTHPLEGRKISLKRLFNGLGDSMRLWLCLFMLSLGGCSSLQKWSLRSASPLFQEASEKLTQEPSWEFFKESTPGNLKFLELLYLQDEKNFALLEVLIKGYAGYAFAVPETLAFEDDLKGIDHSPWKKEAIIQYTKALDYGLAYLKHRGISAEDLLSSDEEKLLKTIKKKLDEKDFVSTLYFAQAWGSLINLQKDNIALVSQVPRVKILFDWVCGKKPLIENGICDIFYAQYEAARPRMLGGNPQKGEELYLAAIEKFPHHLLIRLGYIQFVAIPAMDLDKFEAVATPLRKELEEWESVSRDGLKDESSYAKVRFLNLYNSIAKKRLNIIDQYKQKIF
jgi:hypothetical protein